MSDEASVQIEAVVICDQIRFENNGKALFIGVYNDVIMSPTLPLTMVLSLAIAVRAMSSGPLSIAISLFDPMNNDLANGLRGEGKYEGEAGRLTWFPIGFPATLGAEGEYRLRIEIGEATRTERFLVRKPQPQAAPHVLFVPN